MLTLNAGKNLLTPGHPRPKMIEQVSEPYAGKLAPTVLMGAKESDLLGLPTFWPAEGGTGRVGCVAGAGWRQGGILDLGLPMENYMMDRMIFIDRMDAPSLKGSV